MQGALYREKLRSFEARKLGNAETVKLPSASPSFSTSQLPDSGG
jgi:hypothetical protein